MSSPPSQSHGPSNVRFLKLADPVITPEIFAQTIVEDYNLSATYHNMIVKSIQDQLSDYKAHSSSYDGEGGEFSSAADAVQAGNLGAENAAWWESWRKRLRTEYGFTRSGKRGVSASKSRTNRKMMKGEEMDSIMTEEDLDADESTMHEDMRILIKVCHLCNGSLGF